MKEILDTRFLIEHFVGAHPEIRERTRRRLRALLRRREGIIPTIALAEFVDQMCRLAGRQEAARIHRAILASGLVLHPLTPAIAAEAGALRCTYRGVPMADCIVAATAVHLDGRVLSDDPHFRSMRGIWTAWL